MIDKDIFDNITLENFEIWNLPVKTVLDNELEMNRIHIYWQKDDKITKGIGVLGFLERYLLTIALKVPQDLDDETQEPDREKVIIANSIQKLTEGFVNIPVYDFTDAESPYQNGSSIVIMEPFSIDQFNETSDKGNNILVMKGILYA